MVDVCDTIIREEAVIHDCTKTYTEAAMALINLFTSCQHDQVEKIICSYNPHTKMLTDIFLRLLSLRKQNQSVIQMVFSALERMFILAPYSRLYFCERDGETLLEQWLDDQNDDIKMAAQLISSRYLQVSLQNDPSDIFF
jgi:hypothetical protein